MGRPKAVSVSDMALEGGLRPVTPAGFSPPGSPPQPGSPPMLQWVEIAALRIDDSYQRPIYGAGRSNVRRIADGFCWSKFAPLIVAPIEGGLFAVIDGQHRATAAALIGIRSVPAVVMLIDQAQQAAAFRAINGQVTQVSQLTLQRAALASGDPAATELAEACAAAGVRILPYPVAFERLRPGDTLALKTLQKAFAAHGRATLITALTCITETSNNNPGVVCAGIVQALVLVLAANPKWRESGEALLKAFDEICLESELEEARVTRRPAGVSVAELLARRLTAQLRPALGDGGAGRS